MRRFWLVFVLVFILTPMAASAKMTSLPAIIGLNPKAQEQNYYDPIITVKFNQKVTQRFSLTLKPNVKQMKFNKKAKECSWELKPYTTFQPKTNYRAVVSSPQYFIFQGKKTKQVAWTFTTADKQSMAEQWEGFALEQTLEQNPLNRLLPHEESNFLIMWPEQGVYTITLEVPFNAGINGLSIKEQLKSYYTSIEKAKKAALKWIRSKEQNPNKMKIKWDYTRY